MREIANTIVHRWCISMGALIGAAIGYQLGCWINDLRALGAF